MDLKYSDGKIFLFPRLGAWSPKSCFIFADVESPHNSLFIQTEELNEHCQISFALRSYVEVDEDFKIKKVMLDSFKANTFVLAKKYS